MMTPDTKVRVSILERIFPALACAVVAISGAVGGGMLLNLLSELRQAEAAGYASVFGGFADIEVVVGSVLMFAAALGSVGILVSLIRLVTTNTTSSPPGVLFLLMGVLGFVPPIAYYFLVRMMKATVLSPDPTSGGLSDVLGTINAVSYFAIGAAAVIAIVQLAMALIPFSSRPGKKASPLICLAIVQILIVAMAGVYFWQARESTTERDRPRDERTSYSTPPETPDANSYEAGEDVDPGNTYDIGASSNQQDRTISGGVLNEKAIELPQPAYPPLARRAEVEGTVSIEVTVDEKGNVIEAKRAGGHPLLSAAALNAARKAKFKPTKLNGQPVKVTGVITYNFSLQ